MTRVPVSELLDLAPADTSSGDGEERPADRPGQLGRYHVRGELGRGGMGAVLRAFDRDIRREVAVKVMLPGTGDRVARARFLTEGQVTGQLEHPNIVPVHELGLDADGRMFIAMRLVRGRSLRQVLKAAAADPGTFPLVQRLDVFRKVCDAVAFAHSRGVIHRDLKPDNVMVGHFGEVQVMDWGLARLLDAPDPADRAGLAPKDMAPDGVEVDDDGTARTLDGQIVGTPAYMPPEQVEGDRDAVDQRADIYALGACLYELLTLTPPYQRMTPVQVFAAIYHGRLDPPSRRASVPRDLEAIVLRAMAHEPRRRYSSVEALRADVDAWLAHEPVTARRAGPVERLARFVRRRPSVALSTGFVLLVGVIAAGSFAALAAADAETQRLAASRADAEREKLQAEVQATQLGRNLQIEQLAHQRSIVARDFEAQLSVAHHQGIRDEDFIKGIPQAQQDHAIDAFRSFIDACDEQGTPGYTADDCFYLAVFHTLGRDDREAGFHWLERALKVDPQHRNSRNMRAQLLRGLGRRDEALAQFQQLAAEAPHYFEGQRGLGQVLQDLGRDREAIAAFSDAIAADPARPDAWNDRAISHVNLGEYADAIADAQEALRRFRDNVHALNTLGAAQLASGDVEAAAVTADRMVATSPDSVRAWSLRAAVRRARSDASGALADATRATQVGATDAAAWVELGLAHAMAGRQNDAIAAYSRALAVNRDMFEAWFDRGLARFNAGQYADAIADLGEAIRLRPRDFRPWNSRGAVRATTGDFAGARDDIRAALERNPTEWTAWQNLAGIEQRLGHQTELLDALEQAWRHCPDAAEKARLAGQLRQLGREPH